MVVGSHTRGKDWVGIQEGGGDVDGLCDDLITYISKHVIMGISKR